jgi:TonB-linked SusC/RagA family outer membrane protein
MKYVYALNTVPKEKEYLKILFFDFRRKFLRMRAISVILLLFVVFYDINAQIKVTGIVKSAEDNQVLPGVAVIVKGTQIASVTDAEGKYSITVPSENNTLIFSFVGLKSQEVQINGQSNIDVVLQPDIFKFDDVVVSGVASATPKRKLSVSVAKVSSGELEAVPASSAATALQGKVAGITIVGGGDPGESAGIRLRSSTSVVGSQDPLYIIDGVMIDGDLSDYNVDDIESIEVVKGAAASALYGSRAGSGVIVIHTKRGAMAGENQTQIRIRNEFGISQLAHKIKLAEHHPYLLADDYKQEGYTKYAGVEYPEGYSGGYDSRISGSRMLDYDHYADNPYSFVNDVQDEIFRDGSYYTNYASIASNSRLTSFMFSFENNNNAGIVFNKKGQQRQSFRVNADQKISNRLNFSGNLAYTKTKNDLAGGEWLLSGGEVVENGNENTASAFSDALFMNPDVNLNMNAPLSDSTILKKYFIKPDNWSISGNPKHTLYYESRKVEKNNVLLSLNGNYTVLNWLILDMDYGMEYRSSEYSRYVPVGFQGSALEYEKNGAGRFQQRNGLSQTFQTTLNFNKSFGELVTKAKLSYLFEKSYEKVAFAAGDSILAAGVTSLSALSKNITIGSNYVEELAKNYFAILDADYKDRYIVSILYRYDGSSLFGEENRWNPYYRVSLAYRLGEDIKIPNIDELKLRYSVGTSGQRPGFDFQYETFQIINGQYFPYSASNKAIKPSETKETEIGMNIQFFKKFEAEITYSSNQTTGAFIPVPLSAASGFQYQWRNAATLEGNSFEWSMNAQVIKTRAIEWLINLSFDRVRQKITKLDAPPFFEGPSSFNYFYVKEGETFGVMYGYDWVRSLDQMKKQLSAGDNINNYVVNSDGYVIIKGSEGTLDEKPIPLLDQYGNPYFGKIANMNPDFNMSLQSSFQWKKLLISMLWSWKNGGDIYNYTKQNLFLDKRAGDFDQAGKPAYQRKAIDYYTAFYDAFKANSYFVEDGSYLKLREFAIYYSFDAFKNKFSFIKGGKIGLLGRNLLTFTKYSGWDPEVASGSDKTNFIVDIFNYPNYRSYSFSLELKF